MLLSRILRAGSSSHPVYTRPIQRFEKPQSKIHYAPEWELKKLKTKDQEYLPTKRCLTTPEKWEYHNKVVWPANYIVPETGLPKPCEVFHVEESFHYATRKIFYACQFVRRMMVDDALMQLKFKDNKASVILISVIEKAKERAATEFNIDDPSNMYIAEVFPIQDKIVKSSRRHAREHWCKIRHRFIHVFVRLEEGTPPPYKDPKPEPNGWEHMENYYSYLRNREIKPMV